MPVIIECDVCGDQVVHRTIGNDTPNATWDDTEKRCGNCALSDQLTAWPDVLNDIKADFLNVKIPELESYGIASVRNSFKQFARQRAKAYFGTQFDAAVATISPQIEDLLNTPISVTITINPGA